VVAPAATYRAAPAIFERLGAEIDVIAGEPDGRNINAGCGSTHPESLAERVVATGAALGFAFDGDGDRVLAVDSAGAVRDGDELIALVAAHLRGRDMLDGGVAVTVMSNYGFHQMEAGDRGRDRRSATAASPPSSAPRLVARRRAVRSRDLETSHHR
jgi:phosphoglucosamine mutase